MHLTAREHRLHGGLKPVIVVTPDRRLIRTNVEPAHVLGPVTEGDTLGPTATSRAAHRCSRCERSSVRRLSQSSSPSANPGPSWDAHRVSMDARARAVERSARRETRALRCAALRCAARHCAALHAARNVCGAALRGARARCTARHGRVQSHMPHRCAADRSRTRYCRPSSHMHPDPFFLPTPAPCPAPTPVPAQFPASHPPPCCTHAAAAARSVGAMPTLRRRAAAHHAERQMLRAIRTPRPTTRRGAMKPEGWGLSLIHI